MGWSNLNQREEGRQEVTKVIDLVWECKHFFFFMLSVVYLYDCLCFAWPSYFLSMFFYLFQIKFNTVYCQFTEYNHSSVPVKPNELTELYEWVTVNIYVTLWLLKATLLDHRVNQAFTLEYSRYGWGYFWSFSWDNRHSSKAKQTKPFMTTFVLSHNHAEIHFWMMRKIFTHTKK